MFLLLLLMVISTALSVGSVDPPLVHRTDCSTLRLGQYICPDPEYDLIDPATQQPRGCTKENKAKVVCKAADGIICHGSGNSTFKREIPCKFTNGYSFETALLLSIFLGMFGADRFYLGYPAMGLLKFCTLGFMFLALEDSSLNSVCQLKALKALNDENHRTQVIGVINTSLTDDDTVAFKEVNRLAESLITLGNVPNSSSLTVQHRKPFGKLMDGAYTVNLDEEKGFIFSEESKTVKGSEDIRPVESSPQVLTTFKLTLDDKEKESRRQVILPYLKTSGGGGGKIIYEPDANDDWDDEDPDDDLEI